MSVTIRDIAAQLELSPATVSRALQQDQLVTPETRARVTEAARRLGYNGRARRSRRETESKAKTHTIGLMVRKDSLAAAQSDANVMKMMTGIMAMMDAHQASLQVLTLGQEENQHGEKRHMDEEPTLVPPVIRKGVCQALIAHGDQDERDLAYLANRIPVVSMGRVFPSLPIDAAVANNAEGVGALVRHLVELGHRRLAWVGAHYTASFLEARQAGFMQGCVHQGLELGRLSYFGAEIFEGHDIRDQKPLLSAVKAGVTGFVCGNDRIALKVIEVLEAAGHRVPEKVSVTGFDAGPGPRQLTTIDPNFYAIGQAAAHLALQRIARLSLQPCVINVRCNLVIGDTTATAPR